MKGAGFILFLLVAANLAAGNIYGTLRENNKSIAGAQITISGPNLSQPYRLATAPDGSFRVFIRERGKFRFQVNYRDKSGAVDIFSYDDPVKYDFDLKYDPKRNIYLLYRR